MPDGILVTIIQTLLQESLYFTLPSNSWILGGSEALKRKCGRFCKHTKAETFLNNLVILMPIL